MKGKICIYERTFASTPLKNKNTIIHTLYSLLHKKQIYYPCLVVFKLRKPEHWL